MRDANAKEQNPKSITEVRRQKSEIRSQSLSSVLCHLSSVICSLFSVLCFGHPSASLRAGFEFWSLDIVSSFEIRYSNF